MDDLTFEGPDDLTAEELFELAGDFVIAENEFWDNLTDEEYEEICKTLGMENTDG